MFFFCLDVNLVFVGNLCFFFLYFCARLKEYGSDGEFVRGDDGCGDVRKWRRAGAAGPTGGAEEEDEKEVAYARQREGKYFCCELFLFISVLNFNFFFVCFCSFLFNLYVVSVIWIRVSTMLMLNRW